MIGSYVKIYVTWIVVRAIVRAKNIKAIRQEI